MPAHAERRFPSMGTTAHVLVVAEHAEDLIDRAASRVDELEQKWSRFLDTSEISQLNHAGGRPLKVSAETLLLVQRAVQAWHLTDGAFDPTMKHQIVRAGYNRPFPVTDAGTPSGVGQVSGGCSEIWVDTLTSRVRLPVGVGFDPGGIGKGLAADLITQELMDLGARGAMTSLGGDLAVRGTPPVGDAWVVSVREPTVAAHPIATVRLLRGGLATSTTRKRTWSTTRGEAHHILDPATGEPSTHKPVLATALAEEAWWAEATATALLARPAATTPASAIRVSADGTVERFGEFERYVS